MSPFFVAERAVAVGIDVKPDADDNPIIRATRGTVPVAILGSASLYVAWIDPASLTFAGAKACAKPKPATEDVDGNGYPDLVVHFPVEGMDLDAALTRATLEGRLWDFRPVRGADAVRVVR